MVKKPIIYGIICSMILIYSTAGWGQMDLPKIEEDQSRLSGMAKVFVKGYKFEGNTVFSDQELSALLVNFQDREITAEELQEAKNNITKFYIEKGYITSGAIVPDQEVKDGIIWLRIIEGRLGEIKVSGNSWLRGHYIISRLKSMIDSSGPLNINKLQEQLKLLKQDEHIENVNAELKPGLELGKATLTVQVIEARPYNLGFRFNNHNSPNIGPYRGEVQLGHNNLTGWGDSLTGEYGITEGVDEYSVSYSLPITRWDTMIGLNIDCSESTVISPPFDRLDIRSETSTWNAFVRQPIYKTLDTEIALGLKIQKSKSKTFLLNEPFAFTGSDDGVNQQTSLRVTQEWIYRSLTQVMAVHSSINFGIDLWDATILDREPDGKFVSWLGQFQWIRQFETLSSQLMVRLYCQLATDPLLPVEKFSIGGASTVRGYRHNQMTTDNGIVGSIEWRVPVAKVQIPGISKSLADGDIQIIPFFDFGHGWNTDMDDPIPSDIYSIGLGARWLIGSRLRAEIFWGYKLKTIDDPVEYDLQDDGIHFQISTDIF